VQSRSTRRRVQEKGERDEQIYRAFGRAYVCPQ
jgi:hypothetical protein